MRPIIAIYLGSPYQTAELYARNSGLNEKFVEDEITQGNLPRRPLGKTRDGKTKARGLYEVNVAALTVQALAGYDVQLIIDK